MNHCFIRRNDLIDTFQCWHCDRFVCIDEITKHTECGDIKDKIEWQRLKGTDGRSHCDIVGIEKPPYHRLRAYQALQQASSMYNNHKSLFDKGEMPDAIYKRTKAVYEEALKLYEEAPPQLAKCRICDKEFEITARFKDFGGCEGLKKLRLRGDN